jgi:uncharacterized protein
MYISLHHLELRPVSFQVDVPADEMEYDGKLNQASPLHAEGKASLMSQMLGEIRIEGKLSVRMNGSCDRCLEAAAFPVERSFDLVYVPADEAPAGGEKEIEEAGTEVGYYEGNGLELNDVLREVVLLALPMQLVCSEDCKGICPTCGQHRNQVDCGCEAVLADDRWSKLKSLKTEIGSRS